MHPPLSNPLSFPSGLTVCTDHVFIVCVSGALTSGAFLTLEGLSLQDYPIPRHSKQRAWGHSFQMQPRVPYAAPSSMGLSNSGPIFSSLISPGPGSSKLGTAPLPRAHRNYSNQQLLGLLTLPRPFLPAESTIKTPAHSTHLPRSPH